jgi:hypothetical protein
MHQTEHAEPMTDRFRVLVEQSGDKFKTQALEMPYATDLFNRDPRRRAARQTDVDRRNNPAGQSRSPFRFLWLTGMHRRARRARHRKTLQPVWLTHVNTPDLAFRHSFKSLWAGNNKTMAASPPIPLTL